MANTKTSSSRKEEEYKPQAVTTIGGVSIWGPPPQGKNNNIDDFAKPPKGLKIIRHEI
jgi:hypothetical protein